MKAGTVVTSYFPGVVASKRRPALIVSSDLYNDDRPDLILAVISSRIEKAISKTDFILEDWNGAGLLMPSFVRLFLFSVPRLSVKHIGSLSENDWNAVLQRLRLCLPDS